MVFSTSSISLTCLFLFASTIIFHTATTLAVSYYACLYTRTTLSCGPRLDTDEYRDRGHRWCGTEEVAGRLAAVICPEQQLSGVSQQLSRGESNASWSSRSGQVFHITGCLRVRGKTPCFLWLEIHIIMAFAAPLQPRADQLQDIYVSWSHVI